MARRFTSIAVKNGIVYILIMLLACIVLSAILFISSKKSILESAEKQIDHTHELLLKEFQNYMVDIENDVRFLSQNPFLLKAAVADWDDDLLRTLSGEFLAFIRSKEDYNQVRLIGIEHDGREIIRAERKQGKPTLIPSSELQSKGNRNYYQEAMMLDEIYFSEIDLNRENGTISKPRMPTLRAATKVKVDGKTYGLIVINLDLRNFFQKLGAFAVQGQSLYLVSNGQDYILHPDQDKTFGFEFGQAEMAKDFSRSLGDFEDYSARSEVGDLSYFSRQWHYPKEGYSLVCTFEVAKETLLLPVWNWQLENLIYVLLVVIGFGFIAFLMMSRQGYQLEKITSSMILYGDGKTLGQLPVERNDEIGELSRTLQRMARSIEDSIQEVQKERDKAVQANFAKEEFLENMSHEIRNPLQSTLGMIDVLFQNNPSSEQEKILRAMRFSAQQLKSLVDDILDYSKLKEGIIKLEPRRVKLSDLLFDICHSYSYEAAIHQVQIDLDVDPKLTDQYFLLDSVRLTQVMNNLISNAIKFSYKKGHIKVEVKVKDETTGASTILFAVKDQGRGMNAEDIRNIGNRYYRGTSNPIGLDGSGLGIPVVLAILKLFEAEIQFDSAPGKGTTAEFQIRLEKPKKEALIEGKLGQSKSLDHLCLSSVLCLDDDPQVRLYFEHALSNHPLGFQLIGSENDWSVIKTSDKKFDLIISDVRFHSRKMTEQVDQLRSKLTDNGVLIFVSGHPNDTGLEIPWLIKPFTISDVANIWVENWYRKILGTPRFESFYADYDGNSLMISRALKLLLSEWQLTTQKLINALLEEDKSMFDSTYHKLTTTLKRLELHNLDSALCKMNKKLKAGSGVVRSEALLLSTCFSQLQLEIQTETESWQKKN